MRAGVIGLFFAGQTDPSILQEAHAAAAVTHAHPLGQAGAGLIALSTAMTYQQTDQQQMIQRLCSTQPPQPYLKQLLQVGNWLESGHLLPHRPRVQVLGNGILTTESYVMAHHENSFDKMLTDIIALRGDTDTIAAMAGGIWGAAHGVNMLPANKLNQLEQREYISQLAQRLAIACNTHLSIPLSNSTASIKQNPLSLSANK